jgi:hypothetical protein
MFSTNRTQGQIPNMMMAGGSMANKIILGPHRVLPGRLSVVNSYKIILIKYFTFIRCRVRSEMLRLKLLN